MDSLSWAILDLALPPELVQDPNHEPVQKVILVFHGDVKDNSKFTPSALPLCLYLGNGPRTWRSEGVPDNVDDPRFTGWARTAAMARHRDQDPNNDDPDVNPSFLRIPDLKDIDVDRSMRAILVRKLVSGVNFVRQNSRQNLEPMLYRLTQILVVATLLLQVMLLIFPGFLHGLHTRFGSTVIVEPRKASVTPEHSITSAVPIRNLTSNVTGPDTDPDGAQGSSQAKADPVTPTPDIVPIEPDLGPYTLVQTMPISRNLGDLISKYHLVVRDNWAYMHGKFTEDVRNLIEDLNKLLTPALNSDPSGSLDINESDVLDVLHCLNKVHETFDKENRRRRSWDDQALTNWINLATWWSWNDPDFDPERYLNVNIPLNSTAAALDIFEATVVPRNLRIHRLVDEVVCSGYEGQFPWHGMRSHYIKAEQALQSLSADLVDLESTIRDMRRQRESSGGVVAYMDRIFDAAEKARGAAGAGMNAARAMAEGMEAVCARTEQSAKLGWRISAQDNRALVREYIQSDENMSDGRGQGLLRWVEWGSNQINPVTGDGAEVTAFWLASETNGQATAEITDSVLALWDSGNEAMESK